MSFGVRSFEVKALRLAGLGLGALRVRVWSCFGASRSAKAQDMMCKGNICKVDRVKLLESVNLKP